LWSPDAFKRLIEKRLMMIPITEIINFETILHKAAKLPLIKVNRAEFLRRELKKYYDENTVNKAIALNPARAGISIGEIEKIAKACINFETKRVTALSAGAGLAGFKAMAVTVPADTAQFFGHVLIILQKLAYLYGWPDIFESDEDELDNATSNELILFIGVMFGVSAANKAVFKIAEQAAVHIHARLLKEALTKGAIYPIVKSTAAKVGVKITKPIFAKGAAKIIPGAGALLSGGVTFALFRKMANRLKDHLSTLRMADVETYRGSRDKNDIIDIDFDDIMVDDIDEINDLDECEDSIVMR